MGHSVAAALQGRAPGVEILQKGGEAGADIKILVRGAGTFGATEPLYVIDGAFSNNGLNSLNPSDIESIEILKDGSAAAIYGSRAANGVVKAHGSSSAKEMKNAIIQCIAFAEEDITQKIKDQIVKG